MIMEILIAEDNSNAPHIQKGDIVFITPMKEIGSSGMYCVMINEQHEIVRVDKQISGQVRIMQDNVQHFEMKLSEKAFNQLLFGKVHWICKQIDHSLDESMDWFIEMLADRAELVKSKQRTEDELKSALVALNKALASTGV